MAPTAGRDGTTIGKCGRPGPPGAAANRGLRRPAATHEESYGAMRVGAVGTIASTLLYIWPAPRHIHYTALSRPFYRGPSRRPWVSVWTHEPTSHEQAPPSSPARTSQYPTKSIELHTNAATRPRPRAALKDRRTKCTPASRAAAASYSYNNVLYICLC